MDFILIFILTMLNALFAMSEMALAASRKVRLMAMADAGDEGAKAALDLSTRPTQFLSTVQVGITSIGMLNGIVGEAAFSADVAQFLEKIGIVSTIASPAATTIVVVCITFFTLIFGELVPKRIGQLYPEAVARAMARPMRWLAKAAGPFVALLAACTQGVLMLMRVDTKRTQAVTEEEIAASLEEGVDAGIIEAHEHQMVRNVFHLDERALISIMVPRSDIEWLDATLPIAHSVHMTLTSGKNSLKTTKPKLHSWYPVCRGGLDDVAGIVSVSALMAAGDSQEKIESIMQAAVFLPETLSGKELLEQFRAQSARMVFVVDEYGVVQGLLTPRDILEAITGELKPHAAVDAWAQQHKDGSWTLDGMMPVAELKARLGIDELPLEEKGRYNTVAGLLMAVAGRMPAQGELVECAGWRFEVRLLVGRRIEQLRAVRMLLPESA